EHHARSVDSASRRGARVSRRPARTPGGSMTAWILGAIITIVLGVVLGITLTTSTGGARFSATSLARARLEREIASLQKKLSEQPDGHDPVATEVWRARQAWWNAQLAKTAIATLNVEGF